MKIQIAYVDEDGARVSEHEVAVGSGAWQAIEQSGVLERWPAIDPARAKIGIYGRLVAADTIVKEGDRIEIYTPLAMDPKQARRQRALRTQRRRA